MTYSSEPDVMPAAIPDLRPSDLLNGERQFKMLVDGVTDYAIYMLDAAGHIASWNAGGERIKGYHASEVLGQHLSLFYTGEDRIAGEPERALSIAAEEGRYETEGWRVRKDGTRFWANAVLDAIYEQGKLVGFAKITRDITERRDAEQALVDAHQALLKSQKMEAIGQLTYGLAHDFNNLLTVIINSLDRLACADGLSAQHHRQVAAAQRAAARGSLLTRQMLAFSRGQTLRPKRCDINALIQGSEELLRRVCDEHTDMSIELQPQLPYVVIDEVQFESALLNLIINARDAMPQGGRILVTTRADTPAPRAGEPHGAPMVSVSVSDEGVGMVPEVAGRAFEPFFTTKEIGKGSGLGLSQVYGFVTQSGGKVEIDSVPGVGTTVNLWLPIYDMANDDTSNRKLKILMVDDDENILEVVEETLRDMGFDVVAARRGFEALEVLQQHDDIDVLFTDVAMPGDLSGLELARRARETHPRLVILLASGYASNSLPDLPARCEFVSKPYRVADLSKKFTEMMQREL
jgi:PAS domain S-box-containing protein